MPREYKNSRLIHFKSKSEFNIWLNKNWKQEEGVWLLFAKKSSVKISITYEEAREVAIQYGWIDGLKNKYDDDFYVLKFTPRRKRSLWSKINREIAKQLISDNVMKPSGLAEVEKAKADGRWDAAYDSPKNMTVPKWFLDLVKINPNALSNFNALKKSELYSIAFNLRNAKKEETKKNRANKYLEQLSSGEKIS